MYNTIPISFLACRYWVTRRASTPSSSPTTEALRVAATGEVLPHPSLIDHQPVRPGPIPEASVFPVMEVDATESMAEASGPMPSESVLKSGGERGGE